MKELEGRWVFYLV